MSTSRESHRVASRTLDLERRLRVLSAALHPFTTTSLSPIAVRAPSALAAGTVVRFRTVSELDGHLSAPVLGHADGAFVVTDPALGIEELTWLVISR